MKMKVTVTFGQTGVVVPCKEGWTVRDLIQQATQRYRKLLEQEGDVLVRTHHVEYCDGGILDPDDILSDLVDDRDKVPFGVSVVSCFITAFSGADNCLSACLW
ncbi:Partitioning defective 3-like protein B [Oryzias melastigma]|uniref:Partitioning defective 3-like protein B n=1 Tax=Oryzias melastigma TaxID=30732 RepID=A0A834C0G2_ORYME|nr:Partitioning defective 3-like protein B [Oryzias melastigma]